MIGHWGYINYIYINNSIILTGGEIHNGKNQTSQNGC